jgi:hypothetical protein
VYRLCLSICLGLTAVFAVAVRDLVNWDCVFIACRRMTRITVVVLEATREYFARGLEGSHSTLSLCRGRCGIKHATQPHDDKLCRALHLVFLGFGQWHELKQVGHRFEPFID